MKNTLVSARTESDNIAMSKRNKQNPDCYNTVGRIFPLCKGANTPQGLAENGCFDCCLYENMKEDWE